MSEQTLTPAEVGTTLAGLATLSPGQLEALQREFAGATRRQHMCGRGHSWKMPVLALTMALASQACVAPFVGAGALMVAAGTAAATPLVMGANALRELGFEPTPVEKDGVQAFAWYRPHDGATEARVIFPAPTLDEVKKQLPNLSAIEQDRLAELLTGFRRRTVGSNEPSTLSLNLENGSLIQQITDEHGRQLSRAEIIRANLNKGHNPYLNLDKGRYEITLEQIKSNPLLLSYYTSALEALVQAQPGNMALMELLDKATGTPHKGIYFHEALNAHDLGNHMLITTGDIKLNDGRAIPDKTVLFVHTGEVPGQKQPGAYPLPLISMQAPTVINLHASERDKALGADLNFFVPQQELIAKVGDVATHPMAWDFSKDEISIKAVSIKDLVPGYMGKNPNKALFPSGAYIRRLSSGVTMLVPTGNPKEQPVKFRVLIEAGKIQFRYDGQDVDKTGNGDLIPEDMADDFRDMFWTGDDDLSLERGTGFALDPRLIPGHWDYNKIPRLTVDGGDGGDGGDGQHSDRAGGETPPKEENIPPVEGSGTGTPPPAKQPPKKVAPKKKVCPPSGCKPTIPELTGSIERHKNEIGKLHSNMLRVKGSLEEHQKAIEKLDQTTTDHNSDAYRNTIFQKERCEKRLIELLAQLIREAKEISVGLKGFKDYYPQDPFLNGNKSPKEKLKSSLGKIEQQLKPLFKEIQESEERFIKEGKIREEDRSLPVEPIQTILPKEFGSLFRPDNGRRLTWKGNLRPQAPPEYGRKPRGFVV